MPSGIRKFFIILFAPLLFNPSALRAQDDPLTLFDFLESLPFAKKVEERDEKVRLHLVGLGGIKKVRGVWNPAELERVNGRLVAATWQIMDGATSAVVFEEAVAVIEARDDARVLFACSGHLCGPSVQWANLVFDQRILYGRVASQNYSVYALGPEGDATHRVIVYSSARTSERQHLHTEIIELD